MIAALEDEIENDPPPKAVLFVQCTEDGGLAKEIRRVVQELKPWTGINLKIVERAGEKLQDILHKSDPWEDRDCTRENCFSCESAIKDDNLKFRNCHKRSIVYEVWCDTCRKVSKQDNKLTCESQIENSEYRVNRKRKVEVETEKGPYYKYIGESSRSIFERGTEHLKDLEYRRTRSHMLRHIVSVHKSVDPSKIEFKMKILTTHSTAFERQIREAVLIREYSGEYLMNSKLEYSRTMLPNIRIELGRRKDVTEDPAIIKEKLEIEKIKELFKSENKRELTDLDEKETVNLQAKRIKMAKIDTNINVENVEIKMCDTSDNNLPQIESNKCDIFNITTKCCTNPTSSDLKKCDTLNIAQRCCTNNTSDNINLQLSEQINLQLCKESCELVVAGKIETNGNPEASLTPSLSSPSDIVVNLTSQKVTAIKVPNPPNSPSDVSVSSSIIVTECYEGSGSAKVTRDVESRGKKRSNTLECLGDIEKIDPNLPNFDVSKSVVEIEKKLSSTKTKSTPYKKIICSKKKKSSLEKISPLKGEKSPNVQRKSPNFKQKSLNLQHYGTPQKTLSSVSTNTPLSKKKKKVKDIVSAFENTIKMNEQSKQNLTEGFKTLKKGSNSDQKNVFQLLMDNRGDTLSKKTPNGKVKRKKRSENVTPDLKLKRLDGWLRKGNL